MQNAGKVGVLVVAFVAMLYAAYGFLGQRFFGVATQTIYANFPDAGGVTPGTRVLMAGVNVGVVKTVSLESPVLAKLNLAIDPEIKIPTGTTAQIPTSLTGIGENVLILVPGPGPDRLASGETISGTKAGALDSVLPNGKEAVDELTKTLAAFRKVLEDEGLLKEFKGVLASANKTMTEFGNTAKSVNGLLTQNQSSFDKMVKDMSASMANVRGLTDELYAVAKKGNMQKDVETILANIKQASADGSKMIADLNKMVSDPELQAALKNSAANMQTMTDSGTRMAANGEKIAQNFEKMSQDFPDLSKKVGDLMDKANEIAAKISGIADDVKGAVKKVSEGIGGNPLKAMTGIETEFDLMLETKPNFIRTDFKAILPQGKGDSFQLGLYNAFEGNNMIAQIGKQVTDNLGIRYGIFASKPGIGVDYSFGPKASLRGDVFSLNDPRFDLRFRYNFGQGMVGWFGVDRVFKDNAPTVGIGIRR